MLASVGVPGGVGVIKGEKRVDRSVPITGEEVGRAVGVLSDVTDTGVDNADNHTGVEKLEGLGAKPEVVVSFPEVTGGMEIVDRELRSLGVRPEDGVVGGTGIDHESRVEELAVRPGVETRSVACGVVVVLFGSAIVSRADGVPI